MLRALRLDVTFSHRQTKNKTLLIIAAFCFLFYYFPPPPPPFFISLWLYCFVWRESSLSGSKVGILRGNAAERMKDISLCISATGEVFVVQLLFLFSFFVGAFFLFTLSHPHCWICQHRAHPANCFICRAHPPWRV